VLRGKQGVGKTIVGLVMRSILGSHYVLVAEPRYVTGRFNSHLASCLLLHADEGFWAGDRSAEGKLKDLITGDQHPIEYKGKEAFWVANHVNMMVTGNAHWVVPAGFEERRFAAFDIGEDHLQDIPYFTAIIKEMENGGSEALLHYLLNFDLKTVNLRHIPKTAALLDQKMESLNTEKGWWLDILVSGQLPLVKLEDHLGCCETRHLFDHYVKHASQQGARRRAIETRIGMFLKRHVPGLIKREVATTEPSGFNGTKQVMVLVYQFPPLAECRQAFSEKIQQDFAWDNQKDWERNRSFLPF
jgi:Family of unknown function (DUF5906)